VFLLRVIGHLIILTLMRKMWLATGFVPASAR
jgi:hypothetical protein